MYEKLESSSGQRQLTYLRVLSEIAFSAPAVLEDRAAEIHDYVVNRVIRAPMGSAEVSLSGTALHMRVRGDMLILLQADPEEWIEEESLATEDQARLIGLRLVTHRALGFARTSGALTTAKPVFELLESILANDGSTDAEGEPEGR